MEIEEFLRSMPGVRDVQVVGVPSRKFGEEVAAFIILKDGAAPHRGRREGLLPRADRAVQDPGVRRRSSISFPLTASGKVQKYKLRELAAGLWPEATR